MTLRLVPSPEPFDRPRRHLAVYLQNILPHCEDVSPVDGWRFGHDSRVGADDHSRVSAVDHIKRLGTKLKTVVGSGFRGPRLADLFLAVPPFSFPVPHLKPEESIAFEVGIDLVYVVCIRFLTAPRARG